MVVFETSRFRVRRWTNSDLDNIFKIYSDQEVVRWVGEGIPITYDQCVGWLKTTQNNYAKRGYGMFAFDEKSTGRTVGYGGIVHPNNQVEPEIKYALSKVSWGKGFATELAYHIGFSNSF